MSNVFPEASLHLPLRESQEATLDLANPFTDGQIMRHPTLRKSSLMHEGEAVNGYIKFRLRAADLEGENETTNHYFNQPNWECIIESLCWALWRRFPNFLPILERG